MSDPKSKVVVTGASGFLGGALAHRLLRDGYRVVGVNRRPCPDLEKLGLEVITADLSSPRCRLAEAFAGAEVVFHAAAKVDMWGDPELFWSANVEGTDRVIAACRNAKVPFLVFTSSPSVIASGESLRGVDESVPYPSKHTACYPATKAEAERRVLGAHEPGVLATVALRPHLIFGEGDTNLIPTVVERARAGRLVKVGAGDNLVDFSYIDDCVNAHLCAWRALAENPGVGGAPYFISQGEPTKLWDWIAEVLKRSGAPVVERSIPLWLAKGVANLAEILARVTGKEPFLTKFLVEEMSTDHYFDISAAQTKLGYKPQYSISAALERTFAAPTN